jgi:membrane associated rhomboid family serine protease
MNLIKEKFRNIFNVYVCFFIPIWFFYILKITIFPQEEYFLGLYPHSISLLTPLEVVGFWLVHANYMHIMGNSAVLFPLLFFIALWEKKPIIILSEMIVVSGLLTWILGSSNTVVIGASGFIFAIFGYILYEIFKKKHLYYILVLLFLGIPYLIAFLTALIPQAGISWAGHFGGLLTGLLIGKLNYRKIDNKE